MKNKNSVIRMRKVVKGGAWFNDIPQRKHEWETLRSRRVKNLCNTTWFNNLYF